MLKFKHRQRLMGGLHNSPRNHRLGMIQKLPTPQERLMALKSMPPPARAQMYADDLTSNLNQNVLADQQNGPTQDEQQDEAVMPASPTIPQVGIASDDFEQ